MIVRPPCPADLTSVIALLNREIVEGVNIFRLAPFDDTMAQRWWQVHGQGRYQAIVAEAPSTESLLPTRIAGWATLAPHSVYEGYDRTAEISVWVDAAYRRQGCGRLLIQSLLAQCADRNIRTVLSRIEANNRPSLRLHEVCGFKRVGLLEDVGEKLGQSLSVVLMQYHVLRPSSPNI